VSVVGDNVEGMNELEKALQDVLDYGMDVIDNLTPEQLEQVSYILGKVK
jgi:hypothetical protein